MLGAVNIDFLFCGTLQIDFVCGMRLYIVGAYVAKNFGCCKIALQVGVFHPSQHVHLHVIFVQSLPVYLYVFTIFIINYDCNVCSMDCESLHSIHVLKSHKVLDLPIIFIKYSKKYGSSSIRG